MALDIKTRTAGAAAPRAVPLAPVIVIIKQELSKNENPPQSRLMHTA